jgi:hypothetical protein
MKTVNAAVTNAIRSNYEVTALPRLIADWNMNRYVGTTVSNAPPEDTNGNDVEIFPLESIVSPLRPTKGINKARVNQGIVADDYITPDMPRYYTASVDDKYKYWQSPNLSDSSGNISGVWPTVIYDSNVDVNKIVVKLENSWATPIAFNVAVTTNGNTWSIIATNPVIKNDGSITLYWNGTGWSSTKPAVLTSMANIKGLRVNVTQLGGGYSRAGAPTTYRLPRTGGGFQLVPTSGANAYFSLIEIAAHREVDLTDRLTDIDDTFDTSDVSQLYPIGSLTTNTAQVTLWNGDGLFSKDNSTSPYKNFLEANVRMTLEYVYKVNNVDYPVQQFQMYVQGPWAGQKNDTVQLDLGDFSTYFQELTPTPAMYEGLTMPQIVYRLCDSVGFVNYNIVVHPDVTDYVIPIFYTDGESTVWEIMDELAKASQSAIYFDAFGVLQIKTRDAAFDKAASSVWTLRGTRSGTELPDIVSLDQTEEFENNLIRVSFQDSKWSNWNNGLPAMQTVWEPEGTVTLRASDLQLPMTTAEPVEGTNFYMKLPPADAAHWPYKGLVNIEGEIMRFDGKRFVYYTGTTADVQHIRVINDADEYKKFNEMTPEGYRYKNQFDGNIRISERGVWNSQVSAHNVEANGYSVRAIINGNRRLQAAGFIQNKGHSTVTLQSTPNMTRAGDLLVATRGRFDDSPFKHYGTKLQFGSGSALAHQTAGIVINNDGTALEDGYYIEITPTYKLTGTARKARNELILYSRKNGKNYRYGGKDNLGAAVAIAEGVEYEIDVYCFLRFDGNAHVVNIWVNGVSVMNTSIPITRANTLNGRFGLFVRGKTRAYYEYLYAIARDTLAVPDDFTYLDKAKGGYVGSLYEREWVYGWRTYTRRVKKKTVKEQARWNQQFMDEFGPIVHEIREFDVKFDPAPVLHSRLYMTNDWSGICTEYRSTPYGANFVIANTSRKNAVVHGDDTISFTGTDASVTQQLTVLGRGLVTADAEEIVVRNEANIKARGESEVTLDSRWVQSRAAANAVAKWIKQHWGNGADQLSVTIFGNTLIEIGDVVVIDYPQKNMTPAGNRYFVTGASSSFQSGITTTLTLRRVTDPVV